ncbi:MAG: LysE family translocator [Pararhizobium sp.]
MPLTSLVAFAGALLFAAAAPGPSIGALVARVLARGIRDVLPFLLAMWVGEAVWLALAVCGMSAIAQAFGALFLIIKLAGVAYLIFLAWKMWTAPPVPAETPAADLPRTSALRMFAVGMAVTLGNPKIMVFYMALLPTFVDLTRVGLGGFAELLATAIGVLLVVHFGWMTLASRARRLLSSRRAVRLVNRGSAAVMAGAAVAMVAH